MKSVKEIRDFNDKYRYMEINAQNTQNLNQFVFDVLIGITEHLEAQERPCDKRAIWGQVDPEVRDVMERLLAAEKMQKKLEEWTENAITGDIIHMTKTTKAEIERAAMIEALRWVIDRMPTGRSTIAAALERIENGGDL